jgi:hypothetical protein
MKISAGKTPWWSEAIADPMSRGDHERGLLHSRNLAFGSTELHHQAHRLDDPDEGTVAEVGHGSRDPLASLEPSDDERNEAEEADPVDQDEDRGQRRERDPPGAGRRSFRWGAFSVWIPLHRMQTRREASGDADLSSKARTRLLGFCLPEGVLVAKQKHDSGRKKIDQRRSKEKREPGGGRGDRVASGKGGTKGKR